MIKKFCEIFEDDTKNVERVSSNEYLEKGIIAIVDQGKKDIVGYTNNENYKICNEERIIFGDHTRIFKYINISFITGADGTKVLKIKDNKNFDYKYFYYYLLHSYIPDTGYNRHFKWVKELQFDVVEYNKQLDIVKKLDKVCSIIEERKNQIKELEQLVKSQFVELFGDPDFNPKNYKIVRLEEIAELNKGITYSPNDVDKTGIIVLRSSNIKGNKFDLNDIVRINKKIDINKLVQENDILMCNRNGSAHLVGKVAKIPKTDEEMTFGTFMTIIRNKKLYEYLFVYFQTDNFRRQIQFQTAVAINQISLPLLADVKIPLPSENELNEFNKFVKLIDKQKFEIEKSLKEMEELYNSLMEEYFG